MYTLAMNSHRGIADSQQQQQKGIMATYFQLVCMLNCEAEHVTM